MRLFIAISFPPGGVLRIGLVLAMLAAGVAVAVATYPLAGPWLHGALTWDN